MQRSPASSTATRGAWSPCSGFNYDSRVRPSATRAPIETSRLSILPLGRFEVHHGVGESHYTLFWFIKFGSKD